MCEGRTETDCTTKGISVQKIMPAPFLHMLVCLFACLLVCLLACLLWVIMIFFFFIVGYEGGSESESEMRYPFFSFFLIWCDAYKYLSYF